MIRFENVGMRYDVGPEVLQDLTFELAPGSFRFLTGPSGAGKTSLLRLLFLGARPSRGTVVLFDEDMSRAARERRALLRRKIGIVFQDFRLVDHLSARENVALPLRIAGAAREDIGTSVEQMLDWVGLGHCMDAPPSMLAGGEKQRVAIARAVIGRPDLLLADEPTGSMDKDNGARVLRLFESLNRLGTTVVFATHDERLVARYPYPCFRLDGGRLEHADPQESATAHGAA